MAHTARTVTPCSLVSMEAAAMRSVAASHAHLRNPSRAGATLLLAPYTTLKLVIRVRAWV